MLVSVSNVHEQEHGTQRLTSAETAAVAADFNVHKDITQCNHTLRSQVHCWAEDIRFALTEGSEETRVCVLYPSSWVRVREEGESVPGQPELPSGTQSQ